MTENLVFSTAAFMGFPLLALLINNLFKRPTAQKFCLNLAMVVALVQIVAAVICMGLLWSSNKDFIEFSVFWNMNSQATSARFLADIPSLMVLLSIGLVVLVSVLTARQTIGEKKLNYCNLLMTILLGMNGIALVNDLFSLYVFLEITGISSFVLIGMLHDRRGLEGAFKYLAMSAIASAFMLAGLAVIFMEAGSLQFTAVAEAVGDWQNTSQPMLLMVAFAFFMTAVSIKAGLVPFHGWLPDAYESAPPAVAVLLGGIVTKSGGVYAIIRVLSSVFYEVESMTTVFGLLGVISILYGAIAAIGQKDFKRMLGYSSISQIGYIILGAAAASPLGTIGALLHFFNHATFKTTLFVNATALEQQVGTTNIENMGGLQARMPVTGVSSILAFLSAAGIPPLAGFWSKLLIIIAAWQAGLMPLAVVALAASVLTAAYFLRLQRKVFFGKLAGPMADVQEVKGPILVSEILLSAITVAFGLAFPAVLLFLQTQGML